jgi:hypothetical protein
MRVQAVTIFFCVLLVIGCATKKDFSVTKGSLSGFHTLPWGTGPAETKLQMVKLEGIRFVSDTIGLRFSGGTWMGHEVNEWILDFWKQTSFWSIRIRLAKDSANADALFHDFIRQYEIQYGNSEEIMDNESSRIYTWRFAAAGTKLTNTIGCSLFPTHEVEVWYMGTGFVDSLDHAVQSTVSGSIKEKEKGRKD